MLMKYGFFVYLQVAGHISCFWGENYQYIFCKYACADVFVEIYIFIYTYKYVKRDIFIYLCIFINILINIYIYLFDLGKCLSYI